VKDRIQVRTNGYKRIMITRELEEQPVKGINHNTKTEIKNHNYPMVTM